VDFLKTFEGNIKYVNTCIFFVEQFNMVPQFFGAASKIDSLFAPFFCDDCDDEKEILMVLDENVNVLAKELIGNFNCPECSSELERDFDPEEYFRFFDELKQA